MCENYMKYRFQHPQIKCNWITATLICLCLIYSCFEATIVKLNSWHRPHGLQSLKYLLSHPLQKMFANPFSIINLMFCLKPFLSSQLPLWSSQVLERNWIFYLINHFKFLSLEWFPLPGMVSTLLVPQPMPYPVLLAGFSVWAISLFRTPPLTSPNNYLSLRCHLQSVILCSFTCTYSTRV